MMIIDLLKKELLAEEICSLHNAESDVFVIAEDIRECETVEDVIQYLQDTGSGNRKEAVDYINYILWDEVSQN